MPLSLFGRTFVHMQLTTLTGKLQVSTSGPSASVPEPRPTHTKISYVNEVLITMGEKGGTVTKYGGVM